MKAIQADIVDEKLVNEVKSSIDDRNSKYLLKIIDKLRPADLADLIEHLKPEERLYLFEMLEPEGAGEVLVEIEAPVQESIINDLDNQVIVCARGNFGSHAINFLKVISRKSIMTARVPNCAC